MAVQTAARTYEGVVVGPGPRPTRASSHRPTASSRHRPRGSWTGGSVPTDYTELGLPGGHIGMLGTTKSRGIVGKGTVDWLVERDS